MISPRRGSMNSRASSAALPRTTSSKRLVSSRQTATGRSGCTAASDVSDAPSLPWRLECDDGVRPANEALPERAQIALLPRQVPDELITARDEPTRHHRGLDSGGAWEDGDVDPGAKGRRYEPPTWIVDPRQPGIGDERDAVAGDQAW